MPLVIPNGIENDTPADAAELQANFTEIATYVNSTVLNRDGSVAMDAPLLLPGDPTQDNHAANKGYVDGHDILKVAKAGDTMTGPLIVQSAEIGNRPDVPTHALFTHKDTPSGIANGFVVGASGALNAFFDSAQAVTVYSAAAGPTYTNRFSVTGSSVNATVPVVCTVAAPTDANHLTRKDYVDTQVATQMSQSEGDARYVTLTGDVMTGDLYVGGSPNSHVAGEVLHEYGQLQMYSTADHANLWLMKRNSLAADPFAYFYRHISVGDSTLLLGSITQVGTSGIAYNTTSDYRVKNDLGDIDDPLGRLSQLRPRKLEFKDDPGEFDGFLAHEVADVAPYAVQGDKDAVLPADHPDNPGGIDVQQLDTSRLVPLLVAAVQQLTARVAELEAAA